MLSRRPALLGTAFLLLSACGGGGAGGGGSPFELTWTLTLISEPSRDGWAAPGGIAVSDASQGALAGTGDHLTGTQSRRQFFSFDLADLPPTAVLRVARLEVRQALVHGTPYTTHGVLILDHLAYDTLDGADYAATPLTPNAAQVSSTPVIETKLVDVTALVQADRTAARGRAQFRVRWSTRDTDNDSTDDQALLVDSEDLARTGYQPRLVLIYAAP
jgi:hypothetical protein